MLSTDRMKERMTKKMRLVSIFAILAMLLPRSMAASSNVPPVVISNVVTVNASGLTTNEAYVALDACGNIYSIASYGGQVFETPAGGGTATTVLSGQGPNYDPDALWIDSAKANLYVTEGPYNIFKIPIVSCVPQPASMTSISIGNAGAVSYYYNPTFAAADASGDVFIAVDGVCCAANNELVEESSGTTLLSGLGSSITSMAVDSSANIYYTSGGQVYKLAYSGGAYSTTATSFGTTYGNAIGVSLDAAGNMYIADTGISTIYEIPNESSGSTAALNPADQFVVATGIAIQSPVAADAAGNLYFTNNGSTIYELTRGSANLGSFAVAVPGTATLGVAFNATETPTISASPSSGAFAVVAGGTCVSGTTYAGGHSCTVEVQFTPVASGVAVGGLVLSNSSGSEISVAQLSGIGTGAGLTVDPGALAAIGSGYTSPKGAALDSSGNLFVADASANEVWELAAGGTTSVAVGSGLKAPAGVAVDGAGDLYIADTSNNRIVEVPIVSGALSSAGQTVIVASGVSIAGEVLSGPTGLTIDPQGNLYIADTGNSRVVFLPGASSSNLLEAFTVGSGFSKPLATTVAPNGTIYIADSGHGDVDSLSSPTGTQTLVATGFGSPTALATDAAGDLFVADNGSDKVVRIPNVSGSLVTGSESNIGGSIADPYGLAIDPLGNLYVTDNVNAAAYSILRTNASQSFGKWEPGTTSTPLTYTLESSGNASLTLNSPYDVASGNTADFTQVTPSTNACSAGASLSVGTSCSFSATFTPASDGNYSETLVIGSNATNGSAQQATFTGIGATVSPTTTTLSVTSPTGSPYYGQPITLSASVTSAAGTPIGKVVLQVDGNASATATLANGVVTFSLPNGLSGGTHTVQALYQGGDTVFVTYAQSSSAVQTISVSKVSTTTTLGFTTAYVDPLSQPACTSGTGCAGLTFTATVTPSAAGIPIGNVTFTITPSSGTVITQSVPLAASGGAFQASYTYYPAAPPSGSSYYSVTAQAAYTGDGNFAGSTSAASSPFYVSPSGGSVVLTSSGNALTASANNSSPITFTPISYGGWNGLVGFTCLASSLPANARCVFSPGQIQVSGLTSTAGVYIPTVVLTVTVNQDLQPTAAGSVVWWIAGPMGLLFLFSRRRLARKGWNPIVMGLGVIVLAAATMGLGGCGSGTAFATPQGTSTITVYADAAPFASGSTTTAQTCPISTQTSQPNPAGAPCSQQAFQVALTVQ